MQQYNTLQVFEKTILDTNCTAYTIIQSSLHVAPLAKKSVYQQGDVELELKNPYTPYGNVCMINTAAVYTAHSPCN